MVVILVNAFLHIDMFYLYYIQISITKRLSGHTLDMFLDEILAHPLELILCYLEY